MLRKKLICVFIAVHMVIVILPVHVFAEGGTYKNYDCLDSASEWAFDSIEDALRKGFVPLEIQCDYQNVITRAEFCRMAVMYIEFVVGQNIDKVMADMGISRNQNAFADTNDPYILAAYALGVTNGTGNNQFSPNGIFSREQAATMIKNVCKVLGADVNNSPASGFADSQLASDWAVDSINFCRTNGIMSGTGNNNFSPKASYTREQSIVTLNNISPELLPGFKEQAPYEVIPDPSPTQEVSSALTQPNDLVKFTSLGVRWLTAWPDRDKFEIIMNYTDSPRVISSGIKCWDEYGNEIEYIGSMEYNGFTAGCDGYDFAGEYIKNEVEDVPFHVYTINSNGSCQGSLVPGRRYYWIGYVALVENNWYYETPMQSFVFTTEGSRFGEASASKSTQTPTTNPAPTPSLSPTQTPTLESELAKYTEEPIVASTNGDLAIPIYQHMTVNTRMNGALSNSLPFFSGPSTASCNKLGDIPNGATVYVYGVTVEKFEGFHWALIDYNGQFVCVSARWIEYSE